jgi:hypothetical protein
MMLRIGDDQRLNDLINIAIHKLLRKRITRFALDEPMYERVTFIGGSGVESDRVAYLLNGHTGYGALVRQAVACEVHRDVGWHLMLYE